MPLSLSAYQSCPRVVKKHGEKTREKKQELLPGRTVLPKCVIEGTCTSVNSSAHKLNQYYFTLWAS